MPPDLDRLEQELPHLAEVAWNVREHAFVIGPTRVGCAVLAGDGRVFSGCNIEHKFRSHDVHAEVNAITSMVAAGARQLIAVVVVAEREQFTPCGACMDWIMQFCDDCLVAFQSGPNANFLTYSARELMPHYPR